MCSTSKCVTLALTVVESEKMLVDSTTPQSYPGSGKSEDTDRNGLKASHQECFIFLQAKSD